MPEDNKNGSNLGESYQPDAFKTYSPKAIGQQTLDSYTPKATPNYQPVVPISVSNEQPTPPTSGSGVPAARSNGATPQSHSAKGLTE